MLAIAATGLRRRCCPGFRMFASPASSISVSVVLNTVLTVSCCSKVMGSTRWRSPTLCRRSSSVSGISTGHARSPRTCCADGPPAVAGHPALFGEGMGTWIGGWGWRLISATDGLVLAALGDPRGIAALAVTNKLAQAFTQLSWVPCDSGLVGLAASRRRAAGPALREAIVVMMRVYLTMSGSVACIMIAANPAFVTSGSARTSTPVAGQYAHCGPGDRDDVRPCALGRVIGARTAHSNRATRRSGRARSMSRSRSGSASASAFSACCGGCAEPRGCLFDARLAPFRPRDRHGVRRRCWRMSCDPGRSGWSRSRPWHLPSSARSARRRCS